jgi:hypothetical protein
LARDRISYKTAYGLECADDRGKHRRGGGDLLRNAGAWSGQQERLLAVGLEKGLRPNCCDNPRKLAWNRSHVQSP